VPPSPAQDAAMNRLAVVLLLASAGVLPALPIRRVLPPPPPVAITHVTVIDATGAPPQPDMTVVLEDGRIARLGRSGTVRLPEKALVFDAKGKFLIPGLWDMHAHLAHDRFLDLFLANGVTGVRHMYTAPPILPVRRWREAVEDGRLLGPRIVMASRAIDGAKPVVAMSAIPVGTPAEARGAVRHVRVDGDDFVKVYPNLTPEAFYAVLEEADRASRKLAVSGHVPHAVNAGDASDRGMRSMEHGHGVLLACSKDEEQLRKDLLAMAAAGQLDTVDAAGGWRAQVKALDSYDEKKAAALFAKFVKNGTWQVPTLIAWWTWGRLDDPKFRADPRKQYLPLLVELTWRAEATKDGGLRLPAFGAVMTKADQENRELLFRGHLRLVGAMHKAGVKILAGTDAPVPYVFPGFSLHEELELLVRAGMTPMEALQAATRNPAEYLDRLTDLGTVEKGKLADLVLLDANPLDDIRNTRKIHAVVTRGRVLPRASLQALVEGRKP
jgi:cytosine/adenosine deaminase-related metal-dependent hydrolase